MFCVLCFMFCGLWFVFCVLCFMFYVLCFMFSVFCFVFCVPRTKTKNQSVGTRYYAKASAGVGWGGLADPNFLCHKFC